MAADTNNELSQSNYTETPYDDASWEIIGEAPGPEIFIPMQVEVLPGDLVQVDPMFANYGGLQTEKTAQRWHLPEHLATQGLTESDKEDEPEIHLNKLTNQELNALIAEAEERGKERALEQMVESQNEKLAVMEKRFGTILSDLKKQIEEHIKSLEKETVELSLAISNKVINRAVDINPEYIAQVVQDALKHCGSASIHKIRVSPEDMEFIKVVGIAKDIKNFDVNWQFEGDAGVRSGCIVETSSGEVDFQLDKAWDRIKENVMKVLR